MYAKVVSESDRLETGLGALKAGEPQYFDAYQVGWFWRVRGIPLTQDNMAEGVTVTIHTGEMPKEDENA